MSTAAISRESPRPLVERSAREVLLAELKRTDAGAESGRERVPLLGMERLAEGWRLRKPSAVGDQIKRRIEHRSVGTG